MDEATNTRVVKTIEVLPAGGPGKYWKVVLHYAGDWPDPFAWNSYAFKYQARREGRRLAKQYAEQQGTPVQLIVKKRNGQIPKGGHGHTTYGYDPESSKDQ